jgi:rhamnosyltransferase
MEKENTGLPHVAVLMATYNGEKYLRQQVDSILAQKNVRVSLYVRDDRSSDNTAAIINEYCTKAGNVFLLNSKPVQLNVTKNFFSIVRDLDLSGIDYISYSDQDDIWLEEKLDRAVKVINANKVNCYASNLLRGDANGNIIKHQSVINKGLFYLLNYKSNKQLPFDFYFEAASAGCTLVLNNAAAKHLQQRIKEIYEAMPVNASHDWSTYALTRLGGYQWFIDSRSYIIYRQHTDNAYGTNNGLKGVSKLLDLFTSGWYRKHILLIEDLYNTSEIHPAFIEKIRVYKPSSIISRFGIGMAICKFRRKPIHRVILFFLIMFGYFK